MKNEISKEDKEKYINAGDVEHIFKDKYGNICSTTYYSRRWNNIEGICTIYSKYLNKCNLININSGELLLKKWYFHIGEFSDGYCLVNNRSSEITRVNELIEISIHNDEYNYITLDDKLLSNKWFTCATDFYSGLGMVMLKNDSTFYFIDTRGNLRYSTNEELDKYQNERYNIKQTIKFYD